MTVLVVLAFALVAAAGTAVVLSRDAQRQAITLSALGLTLTVLFLVLQAPDVALSQLAIGAAVVPLMVMLTLREISQHPSRKDRSARS
jgi:energy-converting hydrogenase B subunit D